MATFKTFGLWFTVTTNKRFVQCVQCCKGMYVKNDDEVTEHVVVFFCNSYEVNEMKLQTTATLWRSWSDSWNVLFYLVALFLCTFNTYRYVYN